MRRRHWLVAVALVAAGCSSAGTSKKTKSSSSSKSSSTARRRRPSPSSGIKRMQSGPQGFGNMLVTSYIDDLKNGSADKKIAAAEALGNHSGADALTCGVDRRSCSGRAAAHDQYVKGILLGNAGSSAISGTGVDLGENLLEVHSAGGEGLAIEEDRRHCEYLARLDLVLEERTVDGHVTDARIDHAHQVEGLHHVRAVLAGEGEVGLEVVVTFELANLIKRLDRSS